MTDTAPPQLPNALPAILLAVQGFDLSRIIAVLDDEADRHGLDSVIDDVVFPALRTVGTYWAHGSFSVTHEHLFTAAATRWLHARLSTSPATTGRPTTQRRPRRPVVLAAGPDDLHVIGLDCLELLLTARGVTVCNLGALVPADALLATATAIDAGAVVICSHAGLAAASSVSATASLRTVHAAGLAVYYAGSSFDLPFVQRRTPGIALSHSVTDSANLLARHVSGPFTDDLALALARQRRAVG